MFLIFTYLFLFNFSYLAEDNNDDNDDEDDSSYQDSEGDDISLGSQDTNIDNTEIQDLEKEEALMSTPQKAIFFQKNYKKVC